MDFYKSTYGRYLSRTGGLHHPVFIIVSFVKPIGKIYVFISSIFPVQVPRENGSDMKTWIILSSKK